MPAVAAPSIFSRLTAPVRAYTHWLHTMWPAGTPEKLPIVNEDGSTAVPGLYVVGDLTGIPLLKFSADTGAKAVRTILGSAGFVKGAVSDGYDLIIIGAGVSGMAAALEARKAGLKYLLLEASEPFSTIINFPKQKHIFTYPTDMTPAGDLQFHADVKEALVDEIRAQTAGVEARRARAEKVVRRGGALEVHLNAEKNMPMEVLKAQRVIVAIGRSGNFRKLGVPGEEMGKVYNRLHDPKEFAGKNVLVVGGGDSAAETAIACTQAGANVTFSFRGKQLDRPKPENVEKVLMLAENPAAKVQVERPSSERQTTSVGAYMGEMKPGSLTLLADSKMKAIRDNEVDVIDGGGQPVTLKNDVVFAMIGREPPLDFFRRSGVPIHGERSLKWWATLIPFFIFCVWMYHWKKGGVHITGIEAIDKILDVGSWWQHLGWFPHNVIPWLKSLSPSFGDPATIAGTLANCLSQPGFYYSLAYCLCVVIFGIDRVRRRRTPYVRNQTIVLAFVQCFFLFFLPYMLLPYLGHNGVFAKGTFLGGVADHLFEPYDAMGYDRAYWRAFGFILAWPLFFYNMFTDQPMWGWLIISVLQTFVLLPAAIYFFGKGVYCGWICSCGALAETLGDRHRTKMPHGPFWNRFNMVGQVFLAFAFLLLALRVGGWVLGQGSKPDLLFHYLLERLPVLNYKWFVDLLWAGIFGVGLYFWFSGRVWCRFACPLAALMHIYSRFSRFGIIADKKKCISCNVCTSVCHQGIDIMNFANKGLAMKDPECVRCSACVQSCPTGVLTFGMTRKDGTVIRKDKTIASRVHLVELTLAGKSMH
jgi:thioredoxin reductase/polyferredoxin